MFPPRLRHFRFGYVVSHCHRLPVSALQTGCFTEISSSLVLQRLFLLLRDVVNLNTGVTLGKSRHPLSSISVFFCAMKWD